MSKSFLTSLVLALFLVSCGGGGGGGGSDPSGGSGGGSGGGGSIPFPTVSISSDVEEAEVNTQVTLTWSSTDANSCTASGAWSGTKGTNGSQSVSVPQAGTNTYSLSCSNATGSASNSDSVIGYRMFSGKTFDGYISGAEIFIDTNDNKTQDEDEFATTSATDGDFNLRYTNGTLISKNGTDADTLTPLTNYTLEHKLSGYTESKIISPITSLAAYFEDANNINAALGIDSTLDITITDPIPNKEDKGANSYLYEKGAQATVLALALTNIANKGFGQNQDIATDTTFDMIAKELEAQYNNTNARVDIEREDFLAKVVDRLSASLDTNITDANKTTVSRALSNLLPIIEVKDNAEVTVAAMSFGLNLFQEDIPKLASGTASDTVFNAYQNNILSYIATDQGVNADELAPNITAIDDTVSVDEDNEGRFNVLNNDSYLTAYEIGLTITSEPSNGTVTIDNGTLVYQPELNYNGSDSITYQITQGSKVSSATVNITINPINDAPELNFASSFAIDENSTLVGVMSASDADGDDLEISLSGGNADLFTIDSNTFELSFKEAPDYESGNTSFTVTIVAADAEFTVNKDVAITVNNLNDNAPLIDGPTEITTKENIYSDLGIYTASDDDGDSPSFKLGGTDGDKFQILPVGRLSFRYGENDYEKQATYDVNVIATDGLNETPLQVSVEVENVVEELYSFDMQEENDKTNKVAINSDGTAIIGELDEERSTNPYGKFLFSRQGDSDDSWVTWQWDFSGPRQVSVAASGDGTMYVVGYYTGLNGSMCIYQIVDKFSSDEGKCWNSAGVSNYQVYGSMVDISANGDTVVGTVRSPSSGNQGFITFNYTSGVWTQVGGVIGDGDNIQSLDLSLDGKSISVVSSASSGNNNLRIYKLNSEDTWENVQIISDLGYSKSAAINKDGSMLAYSRDANVYIWDVDNASLITSFNLIDEDEDLKTLDDTQYMNFSFSADGNILAVGLPNASITGNSETKTGKVIIYRFVDGVWTRYLDIDDFRGGLGTFDEGKKGFVSLSHDGSRVAVGSELNRTSIYDAVANSLVKPEILNMNNNLNFFNQDENTTFVTKFEVSDSDSENIEYYLRAEDTEDFEIKNNNELHLKFPANYEHPLDYDSNNSYITKVMATDGLLWDTKFIQVDVKDLDESPGPNEIWAPAIENYYFGDLDLELSNDGKTMIVLSGRSNLSSEVKVFKKSDAGNWIEHYSNVCGDTCHRVSISGDGNIIAWAVEKVSWNHVSIVDITDSPNGGAGISRGSLNKDDQGRACDIDLDEDGSTIVVGQCLGATSSNRDGKAVIYTYVPNEPDSNIGSYYRTGYIVRGGLRETGSRVAINKDGSKVAVVSGHNDNDSEVGIYSHTPNNNLQQNDNNIQGTTAWIRRIADPYLSPGFAFSLDANDDFSKIIIGSHNPLHDQKIGGYAKVFDCSGDAVSQSPPPYCEQIGNTILGEYNDSSDPSNTRGCSDVSDHLGYSVATGQHNKIVVSSLQYPNCYQQGKVSIYQLQGSEWVISNSAIGTYIDNSAGRHVDINLNADTIIYSEPGDSQTAKRSGSIKIINE